MTEIVLAILIAIPVYIFTRKHLLSELYNIDEFIENDRFEDATWNEYMTLKKTEYRQRSFVHALILRIYNA